MELEECEKCQNDTFKINSQAVNGGYTADKICTKCGHEEEIIDTYNDL